jgi:DNA-binding IclR family transcriptional regulator
MPISSPSSRDEGGGRAESLKAIGRWIDDRRRARHQIGHGLTADRIRKNLPQIRAQYYALDHGELVAGISALAVAILPPKRDAVASIAINMTSARLAPERLAALLELLKTQVARIEETINPLEGAMRAPRHI